MLEQEPEVRQNLKIENDLEIPAHLEVANLMKEKNAFFVHMIQVTGELDVSENNKSIDTKNLSIPDKLDLLYGASPSLSASTLRPHTNDGTFYGGFGVIFSHGEVEHASASDEDTKAVSLTKRHIIGGARNEKEDIDKAIDRPVLSGEKTYNELVLKNPEVSGGFMKLDNFHDRIKYEEEEQTYYDGETKVTKLGIIDFSPKKDRFGRPTGGNADKPFSVLLEMSKRGKVFVMDEGNQMYIVQNIDEKNKTATFIASPITPADYSFYYGAERMNKYNKKEIADRLEESLQKKGMALH
jgi:hypothetical protein